MVIIWIQIQVFVLNATNIVSFASIQLITAQYAWMDSFGSTKGQIVLANVQMECMENTQTLIVITIPLLIGLIQLQDHLFLSKILLRLQAILHYLIKNQALLIHMDGR